MTASVSPLAKASLRRSFITALTVFHAGDVVSFSTACMGLAYQHRALAAGNKACPVRAACAAL
jgi:hypothetical protein